MERNFSIIIEHDTNGYTVSCPELDGCYSQGETYEEAIENIRDAILLNVADRVADGELLPERESVSLSTVAVMV